MDLSGIRKQLETPAVSRIANVLRAVKSNYLAPFEELAQIIHVGSQEAEDNLKFLSALSPCCQEVEAASPLQVIEILPRLMMVVRMVWNVSNHYNRAERLVGLLRKVSNQIMGRCCAFIPLEGVFGKGNTTSTAGADDASQSPVDESLSALRQSVKCGEAWRSAYQKALLLQNRSKKKPWDFKKVESSIFAQIDVSVYDLVERERAKVFFVLVCFRVSLCLSNSKISLFLFFIVCWVLDRPLCNVAKIWKKCAMAKFNFLLKKVSSRCQYLVACKGPPFRVQLLG